jgi:preprotein translocase subunit SecA
MRRDIMHDSDSKERILEVVEELCEGLVDEYAPEKVYPEEWDLASLKNRLFETFFIHFDVGHLDVKSLTKAGLLDMVKTTALSAYEAKEKEFSEETLRTIERYISLSSLDAHWKEHLLSLDHLREGIGLRGYGQKDPLREYQRESFEIFLDMMERVRIDTVRKVFAIQPARAEDLRPAEPVMFLNQAPHGGPDPADRKVTKIGRNDPCPCGSGKKYKKCCGGG